MNFTFLVHRYVLASLGEGVSKPLVRLSVYLRVSDRAPEKQSLGRGVLDEVTHGS